MSKIVSIHSFRGGTGKSNLTANVATLVAQQGLRVGIVDTDIQSPGIHVLFGLGETKLDKTLNDYLWGRCPIEQTAHDLDRDEVRAAGGHMTLIPASLKAGEITRVLREGYDVGLLNDGFRKLIKGLALDYLFIDTHPGLNEETLLSIAVSDRLIVILRPDQQDYQGTAVTVEVARMLDVPQLFLVVNKALSSLDCAALGKKVAKTYGCPVIAVLPLSEDVARLGSGDIFCLRYPRHEFSLALRKIARQVMEG